MWLAFRLAMAATCLQVVSRRAAGDTRRGGMVMIGLCRAVGRDEAASVWCWARVVASVVTATQAEATGCVPAPLRQQERARRLAGASAVGAVVACVRDLESSSPDLPRAAWRQQCCPVPAPSAVWRVCGYAKAWHVLRAWRLPPCSQGTGRRLRA